MMKLTKCLLLSLFALWLGACADEPSLGKSGLDTNTPYLTDLDRWIRKEFTTPYNIEISYRWNENEVDRNRYLFPPTAGRVQPALEVIQKLWIDSYEALKPGIIQKIAPRVIVLVGGKNINPSGDTRLLGLAEGGKKVVLFEVDLLDAKDTVSATRFISTVQHEYAHILNQTVPFDEAAYEAITSSISHYRSSWYNLDLQGALNRGFISPYASSKVTEDFAEMVNAMLSRTKEAFDRLVESAWTDEAKSALRSKEAMVVEYYQSAFGVDFYKLQQQVAKNRAKLLQ